MSFVQEFKAFAMRGNVVDMAVGIIIGAAFGRIVSSLVNDVIMPPIGVLLGGVDFSNLKIIIKEAGTHSVAIKYGSFLNTVIDFVIITFSIFVAVKMMSRLRLHEQMAASKLTKQEELLTEIRDLLKK